jgi:hypothetical protein
MPCSAQKTPHLSHFEVPDIPGTEDIGLSVRGSVQQDVGYVSQVLSEARRFARSDLIARLQSG